MKESNQENPQAPARPIRPEDTLFYAMRRLSGGEEIQEEERARLAAMMCEKMRPENAGQSILEMIRCAKGHNSLEMLRYAIESLQKRIHAGSKQRLNEIRDEELRDFLKNGKGMTILVGTGTQGHRIFVNDEEIFMSFDEIHSGFYAENFKNLFGLEKEDTDLRIHF